MSLINKNPLAYRIQQMRASAKRLGKLSPSKEELLALIPSDMLCPHCKVQMNLLARECRKTTLTLQHYKDGTLGVLCFSCNSRHRDLPGDLFMEIPPGKKYCFCCQTIKSTSEYYTDKTRETVLRLTSRCKTCQDKYTKEWRTANKEKYNAYQRAYRAKNTSHSGAST